MPGPRPVCECGECHACYMRIVSRRYYHNHAAEVKRKTAAAKRDRRNRPAEPSDAELDRRALILMGRQPNA